MLSRALSALRGTQLKQAGPALKNRLGGEVG